MWDAMCTSPCVAAALLHGMYETGQGNKSWAPPQWSIGACHLEVALGFVSSSLSLLHPPKCYKCAGAYFQDIDILAGQYVLVKLFYVGLSYVACAHFFRLRTCFLYNAMLFKYLVLSSRIFLLPHSPFGRNIHHPPLHSHLIFQPATWSSLHPLHGKCWPGHKWLSVFYHNCCDPLARQQAHSLWPSGKGHGYGAGKRTFLFHGMSLWASGHDLCWCADVMILCTAHWEGKSGQKW